MLFMSHIHSYVTLGSTSGLICPPASHAHLVRASRDAS